MIKNTRLKLREINESDAELIVKWRSVPEVYRYFFNAKPLSVEEHLSWYRNSYLKNDERLDYMAIKADTGERIGIFGIKKTDNKSEVEVSYILGKEYRGQGYAGEAIEYMLQVARKLWKSQFAVAEIHEDNIASIVFIEKLGFVKESDRAHFLKYKKKI